MCIRFFYVLYSENFTLFKFYSANFIIFRMPRKKYLTQKEIEDLINNLSNSEDDSDFSSSDSDWEPQVSLNRISNESESSDLDDPNIDIQTASTTKATKNISSLPNEDSYSDNELDIPTCSKKI